MTETEFVANGPVCGCCGQPTIPPYTGADGYRYEGFYCAGCGAAWDDPTAVVGPCLIHKDQR